MHVCVRLHTYETCPAETHNTHTNTPHEEQLLWDAKCVSCVCAPNKNENKKKKTHTYEENTEKTSRETCKRVWVQKWNLISSRLNVL